MSTAAPSGSSTGATQADLLRQAVPGTVPEVPDHELLRPIGRGAYGEVWLAINVMGTGRAVKVVRRESFESDRPFDREFAALKRYEPLSRAADGLVNVLHAGRDADDSLFYYVMELADAESGGGFDPALASSYRPRTLRSTLDHMGGRLPLAECLSHASHLTQAVASLHAAGLTHRDIKPSNIIFVHGRPKLADIGLVEAVGERHSFVGTEGYIPPEGPGRPGADVYALGMVCYVMATGLSASAYPQMPREWIESRDPAAREFMEIIVRATEAHPDRRYQEALQMLADLALLQSGGSVRRMRLLEHRWRWVKRTALSAAAVIIAGGAVLWFWQYEKLRETRMQAAEELARQARAGEREERFLALRERAAASLRSPVAGTRTETLRAISEAASLHPGDPVLRNLLVTALTRPDFSPVKQWTHDEPYMVPAMSRDGRYVALIEKDGGIRVENVSDSSVVARIPAWPGKKPWSRWRFTADGAYLGVEYGSPEKAASARFRWWRVKDATPVWEGGTGVVSIDGVPAQGHIITGYDQKAQVLVHYDLDAAHEMDRHPLADCGTDFILSPDGSRALFYTGGNDYLEVLCFVDMTTAQVLYRLPLTFMNRSVVWFRDSRRILLGGGEIPYETILLNSDAPGVPPRKLRLHDAPIVDLALSADEQFLLTGSWDQSTQLTLLSTGENMAIAAGWGGAGSSGFSTDGKHCWRALVRTRGTSPVLSWCEFQDSVVQSIHNPIEGKKFERPYFSPDGAWVVVTGEGLSVINLNGPRRILRLMEKVEVQSCAFVQDDAGPGILCGCSSGLYSLKIPASGEAADWPPAKRLAKGDFDEVVASRDGRTAVAYGYNTGSFSIRNGVMTPWPALRGVVSACLSDDGHVAAYACYNAKKIVLQDLTGKTICESPAPNQTWISLSPDGSRVFLNEGDALRCLNGSDLAEIWRVPKAFPNIRSAPVPMQGGSLILARTGLEYSLLDAATGAVRCRLEPYFPFHGQHAAASIDGKFLALCRPNCLLLWDYSALRTELRQRGMDWPTPPEASPTASQRGK